GGSGCGSLSCRFRVPLGGFGAKRLRTRRSGAEGFSVRVPLGGAHVELSTNAAQTSQGLGLLPTGAARQGPRPQPARAAGRRTAVSTPRACHPVPRRRTPPLLPLRVATRQLLGCYSPGARPPRVRLGTVRTSILTDSGRDHPLRWRRTARRSGRNASPDGRM